VLSQCALLKKDKIIFEGDRNIKYDYKAPISTGHNLGYTDDFDELGLVSHDYASTRITYVSYVVLHVH